jgi:hypothetical protein
MSGLSSPVATRHIRGWALAMWSAPPFPALTRRATRCRPVRGWALAMWSAPPFPAFTCRAPRCRSVRGWDLTMSLSARARPGAREQKGRLLGKSPSH